MTVESAGYKWWNARGSMKLHLAVHEAKRVIVKLLGGEAMPKNTRVARCIKKLKARGVVNPYGICQAATKQNYRTGKKKR